MFFALHGDVVMISMMRTALLYDGCFSFTKHDDDDDGNDNASIVATANGYCRFGFGE